MCLAEAMKEARMASIETTKSRRSHVRLDFLASSHKKNKKREEEEEEEGKKTTLSCLCGIVAVGQQISFIAFQRVLLVLN